MAKEKWGNAEANTTIYKAPIPFFSFESEPTGDRGGGSCGSNRGTPPPNYNVKKKLLCCAVISFSVD